MYGRALAGDRTFRGSSPAVTAPIAIMLDVLRYTLAADFVVKASRCICRQRVVDGVAVVAATEMRITVVDLHVSDAHRDDLHDRLQRDEVDRRLVDLDVAVLHPGLVVVTRRQIAGEGHANARRELRVQVYVRGRVVEAEAYVRELIRVHAVDDVRCRRVAVRQVLNLRGKPRAEVELESGELDTRILRGLEALRPRLSCGR